MKIFAGIIACKLNVGLLADPAELEDSKTSCGFGPVHNGLKWLGGWGKEDTFRPENWGRDMVLQPLQHLLKSVQSKHI